MYKFNAYLVIINARNIVCLISCKFASFYDKLKIIKSFVVMLTLICWSVDLPKTFVICNIYQAQNHTFKNTKTIKAYENPNKTVKGFF